jgi:hypothetical protein
VTIEKRELQGAVRRLSFSSELLSILDKAIQEDAIDLTPVVVEHFKSLQWDTAKGVDEAIQAFQDLEATIEKLRGLRAYYDDLVQKAKACLDRAKYTVKEMIKSKPDLVLRGGLGELKVLKNGGIPSLKMQLEDEHKSFTHIVTAEQIFTANIDPEYVDEIKFFRINTERLRRDIESGKDIAWAKLERGDNLRYPKPKRLKD